MRVTLYWMCMLCFALLSMFFVFPGTIVMYCKGAETAILQKTIDGPAERTLSHINNYAEVCAF